MAINFPDSPTNGQVATIGGKNYTYNSTKNTWTPTQVTEADLSSLGSTTVVATHDLLPSSPSAGDMALVSSVNKMYVYFLSGWWLMSSLQNASPSGITGNAALYDLAADGTPTTVTLSSSDPEGFPISWSHSVISGSLGGTTVTNVNNVFTITPSTDAADAGTFTLRFAAADGQGGESGSQSNFTLDFVFIITNSKYTTLLATATGTSDNNNITDSSTNNHSITVNGDTYAGTFSPYRSGAYSMNFGSGASLKFAEGSTSDFNMGTNAFTIEMWIRPATTSSGSKRFYQNRISSMGNGKGSIFQNGSNLYATYRGDNGTDYELTASGVLTADTWTHVCLLRNTSDNTLKLYYNGTLGQSVSVPSTVGIYNSNSNTQVGLGDFGDIANLRVVNGTAITPTSSSIAEIPTNVTNTVLLMIGGNFVDYSGNAPQINNYYGPPEIKIYGPLDYDEYAAADHGGSIFVDNLSSSTDGVSCTLGSAIGTGDFSISGWFYPPEIHGSGNKRIWTLGGNNNVNGLSLLFQTNGQIRLDFPSNGTSFGGSGPSMLGKWQHFCIRRISGTATLHLDGAQVWTQSGNTINLSATNLEVGRDTSGSYGSTGYISDFKISTSSLEGTTVPAAPTSSTGALVHIKGTDASIIDKSQGSNLKLESGTTGSTTQAKFSNTKSIYFGSPGLGLSTSPPALDGEFTIECWVYFNSFSGGTYQTLFTQAQASGGPAQISTRNNNNTIQVLFNAVYTANSVTATWNSSVSTWYHLAVVRDSNNTVAIYVDGTALSNVTNATQTPTLFGHTADLYIGQYDIYNSYPFDGYMQDVRITKGLARYTANFTPPTAPLEG